MKLFCFILYFSAKDGEMVKLMSHRAKDLTLPSVRCAQYELKCCLNNLFQQTVTSLSNTGT